MEPYQRRVIEEREWLIDRISKLDVFLASTEKPILDAVDLALLRTQRDVMQAYATILGARILQFS